MSVTKRVREYTDDDGKTRTRVVWRARVWTYPPHGERRQIEETFDYKEDAETWEREQRTKSRGRNVDVERLTLADSGLWERAEPVLRASLAPRTYDWYRRGWEERVLPKLGKIKVGDLAVGDVERAQAEWVREGSIATARQARYALSAALRVAVRDGLLTANPARSAEPSKAEKRSRHQRRVGQTLRPDQLETLVTEIREMDRGTTYAVMVDLMGSVGLRYGEAAALRVGDLDLIGGVLEVQRNVTESKKEDGEILPPEFWREGNLVWGPPKGGRDRTVPIPEHLQDDLRKLVAGQPMRAQVFRSERTAYVIRENVLKRKTDWARLVARLGFGRFRVHDLRATAITNMLSAGVPPHVVRDIAGHQDLKVTSGYARRHDDAFGLAMDALSDYRKRR